MATIFLIVRTQLSRDQSNYCSQQICGLILSIKNKHTCVYGLILGVRPEGEITSLPFLLPMGVELFLAASSAPSAVLTAFSLDSSFLESVFPAWAFSTFVLASESLFLIFSQ